MLIRFEVKDDGRLLVSSRVLSTKGLRTIFTSVDVDVNSPGAVLSAAGDALDVMELSRAEVQDGPGLVGRVSNG